MKEFIPLKDMNGDAKSPVMPPLQSPVMPPLQSLDFKAMRKAKRLTLRQVEDITGISNPYLSQLETGKIKSPSYNTVRTLVMLYMKKDKADSAFVVGDPIQWSIIIDRKVIWVRGFVSAIQDDIMQCDGQCIVTGRIWSDFLSIHDKSIIRL